MKKRFLIVLSIILMVTAPLTGCRKQKDVPKTTPVPSYEEGYQAGYEEAYNKAYQKSCFDQGGLIGADNVCIFPKAEAEEKPEQNFWWAHQKACSDRGGVFNLRTLWCEFPPEDEQTTQNPSTHNFSTLPSMEWSNETKTRSYTPQQSGDIYFWEMDPYDHTDAGEAYLTIRDFKEITFNNVSDGEGYVIEILDKNGETIHVFKEHSNNFNDNRWWEVQPGWYKIHFVWADPTNASNACMIFARP